MKDDIITLRVSREVKDLILQASIILGVDYKNFVGATLKHVALQVLQGRADDKVVEGHNE